MRVQTGLKFFSLGTMVFSIVMVNTLLFPILPAMRKALDLTLSQASLLVVFVNIPSAIFSPLGGYLADLWGRKAVIIPSMLVFGLGGALGGLAAAGLASGLIIFYFLREEEVPGKLHPDPSPGSAS